MTAQTFCYNLPLVDRYEQLVNNEAFADVFFQLGDEGKLMFAHKNVLCLASEVFNAQLNGDFSEAKENTRDNPIAVEDIEPAVFEEVLRFMYSGKVELNEENVTEVYYASQKYMLLALNEECEKFFHSNFDEKNALNILENNSQHKFKAIDEACLEIICDNPLMFFTHEDFFTLCFRSLGLIVRSNAINCQKNHLLQAIQDWSKINELQYQDAMDLYSEIDNIPVRTTKSLQLHSFSTCEYVCNPETLLSITINKDICLYGVGIFLKTQNPYNGLANLTVTIDNKTGESPTVLQRSIPITDTLKIEPVMFQREIYPANSTFTILAEIIAEGSPKLVCQHQFNSIDSLEMLGFRKIENVPKMSSEGIYSYQLERPNLIAYLLYKTA